MAGEAAVTRFHAWQAARLQAHAAMTRALCHDLRGILAPGLLVAERLQANPDSALRIAGDRVSAMVARVTERLWPDHQAAMDVAALVLETVPMEQLPMPVPSGVALIRELPWGGVARVNVVGFAAAFGELAANSAAAGAQVMRVSANVVGGRLVIVVRDDGSGLSDLSAAALFAPPRGPDDPIGLALARELMRGMGGDLRLSGDGVAAAFEISLLSA